MSIVGTLTPERPLGHFWPICKFLLFPSLWIAYLWSYASLVSFPYQQRSFTRNQEAKPPEENSREREIQVVLVSTIVAFAR